MKAILFTRVSSIEQADGYSLASQKTLLEDYSKKNVFEIADVITLAETASKDTQRKVFNSVIKRLKADRTITEFVVEKTDRLSRNFSSVLEVNDWIKQGENNRLHLVKQNLIITKDSKSDDIFVWRIETAIAERTANNISEEVRKGLNQKAAEGLYPGRKKFGYKTVLEEGKRVWEQNELETYFVKKAFELYSTGYSLKALSQKLFELGLKQSGKRVSAHFLNTILRDPFYIGSFVWNGKTYEAKHKPAISPSVFNKTQVLLSGKGHPLFRTKFFSYGKGLVKCNSCGNSLVGEVQKGLVYYRCHSCKGQKYVREELITKEVTNRLSKFAIKSPRLLNWVKEGLLAYRNEAYSYNRIVTQTLQEHIIAIKAKRQKLYEDYNAGKIDKDFFDSTWEIYQKELDGLRTSNLHEEHGEDLSYKLSVSILELASKSAELFENSFTPEDKWRFLKLVTENITSNQEKIDISFKNGFQIFFGDLVPRRGRVSNNFVKDYYSTIQAITSPVELYKDVLTFSQGI